MSICVWCEAEYTKRTNNQKYCSIACQLERKRSEQRKVHRKVYDFRKLEPSWTTYEEYVQPDLSKYATIREEPKTVITMKPIAVPEIPFKRYHEPKNIVTFIQKKDRKREEWL